jgi:hypothetical protein
MVKKSEKSKQKQSQKQEQNVKIVINQEEKKKKTRRTRKRRGAEQKQPERYLTPEQGMRMFQTYAPPSINYSTTFPNSDLINLLRSNLSGNGGVLPLVDDVKKSLTPSLKESVDQIRLGNKESKKAREIYTGMMQPDSFVTPLMPRGKLRFSEQSEIPKFPSLSSTPNSTFDQAPTNLSEDPFQDPKIQERIRRLRTADTPPASVIADRPPSPQWIMSPVPEPSIKISERPAPRIFNVPAPQDIAPTPNFEISEAPSSPRSVVNVTDAVRQYGTFTPNVQNDRSLVLRSQDRELVPAVEGKKKSIFGRVRDALTPRRSNKRENDGDREAMELMLMSDMTPPRNLLESTKPPVTAELGFSSPSVLPPPSSVKKGKQPVSLSAQLGFLSEPMNIKDTIAPPPASAPLMTPRTEKEVQKVSPLYESLKPPPARKSAGMLPDISMFKRKKDGTFDERHKNYQKAKREGTLGYLMSAIRKSNPNRSLNLDQK